MSKQKIILYATLLIIGYIFLPIVSQNIPIPGKWFGLLLIYTMSLLLVAPNIFKRNSMIILYAFAIIYFFISPITGNIEESSWFLRRWVPLYIGVSLYVYYFQYPNNIRTLRVILWFTTSVIIVSSITTIIGLYSFPEASRHLASNVGGDIEMASFYQRFGIIGYGFITALAYIIPLFVLFYKKSKFGKWKMNFLLIILILSLVIIKAQYTTQFLLFFMALLMAWFGVGFIIKYKSRIVLILIIIVILPNSFYASIIDLIANIIPGETLKLRLNDLSKTLMFDNIALADTHTSSRFSRIPYLLSEFIKSPFIGGGGSTGHVYWLDHLSLYGILGIIPWILILKDNYNMVTKRLKKTFLYYQIAFLMFIALGFMKGSGNREQYIILFFILPLGLMLYERNELFKRKKYVTK